MFGKKTLGSQGENLAAKQYQKDGYTLLETNFRTRQGEIDLIVQKGNTLVFCEVKTRTSAAFAAPCEFVTPAKQKRIMLTAQAYLAKLGSDAFMVRFDVVEVLPQNGTLVCHCIENAFTG